MQRILNVANRLPVTVGETITKSSGGLVAALEGAAASHFSIRWVGWPGGAFDDLGERERVERLLDEEFGFSPVFLTEEEVDGYYHGLANRSLWPLLHYMSTYMRYDESEWEQYVRVNERFADKVVEVAEDEDLVWIHDYHLMLLPALLRQRKPSLRIGFFFHTPFPSSEIMRCHPRRAELMRGVLGADIVGFHTFGYLRHFRSTSLRVLGLESEVSSISDGNHETSLGVYPIGINARKFQEELGTKRLAEKRAAFRENWGGRRIVLSVERLDYTKGILHRLEALDEFFSRGTNVDDVVFILVGVPSREAVLEYQELRDNIEHMVGRINGRHATVSHSPVHFIHRSVDFTELCALYALADVALVTPLVDGMNLVAKEYVACQDSDDPGVLILSEFAGAAQELFDAVIVNPYDMRDLVEKLEQALELDVETRRERMFSMRERVLEYDADYWATSYLDDLLAQTRQAVQTVGFEEAAERITKDFSEAATVALFLDYDGTLREFENLPHEAFPNEELSNVLGKLSEAVDLDVYIISGRRPADLDSWFSDYRFALIAEHGNTFRVSGEQRWRHLNPNADLSWKPRVVEILKHYEGSTPGSFVEEKGSAVVWHYRRSDPEFGLWKAHHLMSEIYEMLSNLPVEIHHGKKIVEVSSIHVNKGAAVENFLRAKKYDFVLCAGDDQTDEGMFRVDHPDMVKVKVGEGDTRADYRVGSPRLFRELLSRLLAARAGGVVVE